MTAEDQEIFDTWQRNRHRPPEHRLQEDAAERPQSERSKDIVEHQGEM